MSRPSSGQRSRPTSGKNLRNSQNGISYEDLLVAQYLEELRKTPGKNGVNNGPSPYGQKLSHTHIVPTQRPLSATAAFTRPRSSIKPKIDAKFIADHDLWDPATPREKPPPRSFRKRPISAPVYHRRPLSATYGGSFAGSRPGSAKSQTHGRRIRPLYKKQAYTIVVTAYKNGSRDVDARVAAPSVKMLLEIATDKLSLGGAGRRVFLDDGTEVYTAKEIPRDADVYISMGENFRDPYKNAKKYSAQQQSIAWTMNGLLWNNDGKKRSPKVKLSKRFQGRIEQSRRRVLVFRNGKGTDGVEIVADPERFEDFLQWCTAKLELGSYARVLYDWEGNEIQDLKDAPVLDNCLQTWSTPVLGPLWVSKGECFNPLGVEEFLSGLITYTKAKLKEANLYQKQLRFAQDENTRNNVEIVAILSMAEAEIEETLEIVSHDVEDFSNALNRLNQQLSKITDIMGAPKEGLMDTDFTLSHIKEIKADSKHVGLKGLRLKVYENGTYEKPNVFYFNLGQALRGIKHKDDNFIMARLLDECSNCQRLATPVQTPNVKPVAQKLYDNQGNVIKAVRDLEYDQEVWLSFGEPWKNPFTFVLTVGFDKVHVFDVIQGGSLDNTKVGCLREQLFSEDTKEKFKLANFDVLDGVPQDYAYADKTGAEEFQMNEAMSVTSDAPMLRSKNNPMLLLYGDISVDEARKPNLWPTKAQFFRFTQEGHIRSKVVPNLVLTVTHHAVHCALRHPVLGESETEVRGYHVELGMKAAGSPSQDWNYTPDGFITSSSHPELYLTYLGSRAGQEMVVNMAEGAPVNIRCFIAVCNKLEGKETKAQRWAIKQEATDEQGKFIYTQTENREWNKLGFSWPVKEDGAFDKNFEWPLEGMLVPYAPPVRKSDMNGKKSAVPIRLMVLKNGVRDISKAVNVVGPDLTNMKKDITKKKQHKHKINRKMRDSGHGANYTDDSSIHCDDDLTVYKLEFVMFLERCTTMLDLPFAARRLFDEKGREHFTLSSLQRDQLVYVSTGDQWTSPELTKGEQQRRHLLSNLASDVNQIRQYMALRNPQKITVTDADEVVINQD